MKYIIIPICYKYIFLHYSVIFYLIYYFSNHWLFTMIATPKNYIHTTVDMDVLEDKVMIFIFDSLIEYGKNFYDLIISKLSLFCSYLWHSCIVEHIIVVVC